MKTTPHPQVILITGCSSGFGLLMAARLAARGHRVFATMRDCQKAGPLRDELERRGAAAEICPLDVTRPESVKETVAYVGEMAGKIDALINNAGFGIGGFFEDLTDEEIRAQMETNFFGVLNVTRAVIPFMRPYRQGTIINISSVAGFSASPAFGAYNASKWALEGFSESLRYEMAFWGIKVYCIEPGTYKTKIFYENARYAKHFHDEDSPYYEYSAFLEKRVRDYVDDCHKDPEDVAALAQTLIEKRPGGFRYIPDIESQIMAILRKILPFSLYSALISRGIFRGFRAQNLSPRRPASV